MTVNTTLTAESVRNVSHFILTDPGDELRGPRLMNVWLVLATCMPGGAGSIWNCTDCRGVSLVAYVTNADITRPEDIVTIAKKDTTETTTNQ